MTTNRREDQRMRFEGWVATMVVAMVAAMGCVFALGCGDDSGGTNEGSGGTNEGSGAFTCGDGTVVSGGMCLPDLSCGEGTRQMGNQCVIEDGTACGNGTREVGGACVPDDGVCGEGTTLVEGACVPNDVIVCGTGTSAVEGECVPDDEDIECGEGTTLNTETNTCDRNCDDGMVWDVMAQDCEAVCGDGTAYDADVGGCVPACDEGQFYDAIAEGCATIPTCGGELDLTEDGECVGWPLTDATLSSVCARGAVHFCDEVFDCCDVYYGDPGGGAGLYGVDWADCVASFTYDCEQNLHFGGLRRLVAEGELTVNEEGLAEFEALFAQRYGNCSTNDVYGLPGPTLLKRRGYAGEILVAQAFDGARGDGESCEWIAGVELNTCMPGYSCVSQGPGVYECEADLVEDAVCSFVYRSTQCAEGLECLAVGPDDDRCRPLGQQGDECFDFRACDEGLNCVIGVYLPDEYADETSYCWPDADEGDFCGDPHIGVPCAGEGLLACEDVGVGETDYRCVVQDYSGLGCTYDAHCPYDPEADVLRCYGIEVDEACRVELDAEAACQVPLNGQTSGGCAVSDWCDPSGDESPDYGTCELAAELNEVCAPPECTGWMHDNCAEPLECTLVDLGGTETGFRCIEGMSICLFDREMVSAACPE